MSENNHFLAGFFEPKSVAVVGATPNPVKINYRILQNLVDMGFQGKIYPVNPKAKEIHGTKAFPRLQDVPDSIDLVISAIPAVKTADIMRDCAEIGTKRVVIVAGGFSEGGPEGHKLNNEIAKVAKQHNIRILGPNTLSPVNSVNRLIVSFNQLSDIKPGIVSFAFQSGFYDPKINWLCAGLGVNKMLDMGNKLDINEIDALEFFASDPSTKVLAMHVESVRGNGREFFRLLKEIASKKPTIILKTGRTAAGSRAAASHTGAMALENDVVFDGLIKQTAAIRAHNLEEFFDLAKGFAILPLPKGNRLATIVMSGGEGVMATDSCETYGLYQAPIGDETRQKLTGIMPPWEIPLNPFDAGVCMEFAMHDIDGFYDAMSAIPEDDSVDCSIMQMPINPLDFILSIYNTTEEAAQPIVDRFTENIIKMQRSGKPLAAWRTSFGLREEKWMESFESRGMPVFQSSERAIKVLAAMHQFNARSSC